MKHLIKAHVHENRYAPTKLFSTHSSAARSFIRPAKQQNEVGQSATARRGALWRGVARSAPIM